jgi:protein suppressor of PHYA-105 1
MRGASAALPPCQPHHPPPPPQVDPTRLVSGSDDGTVKLWSVHSEASTATIETKVNVCSVQFSPTNSNLVAFGSANYRVYLYDLRNTSLPLSSIAGHSKAVSYVRFLDGEQLVSASTDSTLRLWDVSLPHPLHAPACAAPRLCPAAALSCGCSRGWHRLPCAGPAATRGRGRACVPPGSCR